MNQWNNGALSNAYTVLAKAAERASDEQRADLVEAMDAIERADDIMLALAQSPMRIERNRELLRDAGLPDAEVERYCGVVT